MVVDILGSMMCIKCTTFLYLYFNNHFIHQFINETFYHESCHLFATVLYNDFRSYNLQLEVIRMMSQSAVNKHFS